MKNYTLITGACGGLGKSFVKLCLKNKENLLITGTSEKKIEILLEELKNEFGDEFKNLDIKSVVCDLSKKANRENLIKFIIENNICINKLINNAGLIIEGDLLRFEDDEILKAIEINCVGTLDLTQKIIKIRDENQKLEILNVASVAAYYPIPHMAVYAATKALLISIMTALSVELKNKNIVICNVCPGGMATSDAMKASIKSMGIGGKLSTLSTDKVAKIALKALKKKKANVVPGFFNKVLAFLSRLFSKKFMAKSSGKIYAKSQAKRNF